MSCGSTKIICIFQTADEGTSTQSGIRRATNNSNNDPNDTLSMCDYLRPNASAWTDFTSQDLPSQWDSCAWGLCFVDTLHTKCCFPACNIEWFLCSRCKMIALYTCFVELVYSSSWKITQSKWKYGAKMAVTGWIWACAQKEPDKAVTQHLTSMVKYPSVYRLAHRLWKNYTKCFHPWILCFLANFTSQN